jgi:hypothetical protein
VGNPATPTVNSTFGGPFEGFLFEDDSHALSITAASQMLANSSLTASPASCLASAYCFRDAALFFHDLLHLLELCDEFVDFLHLYAPLWCRGTPRYLFPKSRKKMNENSFRESHLQLRETRYHRLE